MFLIFSVINVDDILYKPEITGGYKKYSEFHFNFLKALSATITFWLFLPLTVYGRLN